MEITAYLGLGSNLGDREANLREARRRIGQIARISRASSIYETEPVGLANQPWFLNQVIETKLLSDSENATVLGAARFLAQLLAIEIEIGRERSVINGPRVIDIDLLFYGSAIITHSRATDCSGDVDIVVPHPRLHLRRFVLEPICEIAPDLFHPVLKKSCKEILELLDDDSRVTFYSEAE